MFNAAKVAAFNGWACAILAALAPPFALTSIPALVGGLGLAAVASAVGQDVAGHKGPERLAWRRLGDLVEVEDLSHSPPAGVSLLDELVGGNAL